MAKVAKKLKPVLAKAYEQLPIDECIPNDWNPNKMSPTFRKKLIKGIEHTLDQAGIIPPIVVRPHPSLPGKYQIIDGYHRWDILKDLDRERVDAFIINVDTKTAMVLTDTLNYLRGDPDPEAYATFIGRLVNDGMSLTELAEFIPESDEELQDLLDNYDVKIQPIEVDDEEIEDDKQKASDAWVEMKFNVASSQAEVIEAEVARISSMLEGENIRGRALEFMAVNSADTPKESIVGTAQSGSRRDVATTRLRRKIKMVSKKTRLVDDEEES